MLLVLIDKLFLIYTLMIFARILVSWIPELQQYRFVHFIAFYTDPYLNFFRQIIPPLGMIDISPIVALFCLAYLIEPFTKWLVFVLIYQVLL